MFIGEARFMEVSFEDIGGYPGKNGSLERER